MNNSVNWRQIAPGAGATRGDDRNKPASVAAGVAYDATRPARFGTPLIAWILSPPDSAARATILIRCMAGGVFLWEGILKFVYTNQGVGRFTKLGFAMPALTADFVAVLEIVGGALLIAGFLTRLIAIPFVIEMVVAMLSTKVALYLGTSQLPPPPAPPLIGLWAVLHEIRSEYAQLMSVLFLFCAGPGPWSVDAMLARHFRARTGPVEPVGRAVRDGRAERVSDATELPTARGSVAGAGRGV